MDDAARKNLWEDYARLKTPDLREKLIIEYMSLVKTIAKRLIKRFGCNIVPEDLAGCGIFGLIDAVDKFDIDGKAKFETYAGLRIRGAILDQIRESHWIPRRSREVQEQIKAAIEELEIKNGMAPTDAELMEYAGLSERTFSYWKKHMKAGGVISLEEYLDRGNDISSDSGIAYGFEAPDEAAERRELRGILDKALDILTENEKRIIQLYYCEELTRKEISGMLGLPQANVSQIRQCALKKMKKKMEKHKNLLD